MMLAFRVPHPWAPLRRPSAAAMLQRTWPRRAAGRRRVGPLHRVPRRGWARARLVRPPNALDRAAAAGHGRPRRRPLALPFPSTTETGTRLAQRLAPTPPAAPHPHMCAPTARAQLRDKAAAEAPGPDDFANDEEALDRAGVRDRVKGVLEAMPKLNDKVCRLGAGACECVCLWVRACA